MYSIIFVQMNKSLVVWRCWSCLIVRSVCLFWGLSGGEEAEGSVVSVCPDASWLLRRETEAADCGDTTRSFKSDSSSSPGALHFIKHTQCYWTDRNILNRFFTRKFFPPCNISTSNLFTNSTLCSYHSCLCFIDVTSSLSVLLHSKQLKLCLVS